MTSIESYLDFSAQDLEFGFNETRRDRILRTYVRNVYHFHLNEIFSALKVSIQKYFSLILHRQYYGLLWFSCERIFPCVPARNEKYLKLSHKNPFLLTSSSREQNEYTDWERPPRNQLGSRDAALELLSDGHTVAPLIRLGYLHSLRGGKSYFMHYKHRTGERDFPQVIASHIFKLDQENFHSIFSLRIYPDECCKHHFCSKPYQSCEPILFSKCIGINIHSYRISFHEA